MRAHRHVRGERPRNAQQRPDLELREFWAGSAHVHPAAGLEPRRRRTQRRPTARVARSRRAQPGIASQSVRPQSCAGAGTGRRCRRCLRRRPPRRQCRQPVEAAAPSPGVDLPLRGRASSRRRSAATPRCCRPCVSLHHRQRVDQAFEASARQDRPVGQPPATPPAGSAGHRQDCPCRPRRHT